MNSECSHLLLAAVCVLVGTAMLCPIMPLISITLLVLALLCFGLWLIVRPSPPEDEEKTR